MINKPNWEQSKQKYMEFWDGENHDRPLIFMTAPKDGCFKEEIQVPENIFDRWNDTEYIIKSARHHFESTYYAGEAYPNLWPNLGPDILVAYLGCDLEFGESTSWSKPFLKDWNEKRDIVFHPENKWWIKTAELTRAMMKDSHGDYMVGITDLHPAADAISSMRGPENFCMDLYDNPQEVKKSVFEVFDSFKKVLDLSYEMTHVQTFGTSNWMDIWHPGKYYVTSVDAICMISDGMFDEFIMPELLEEIEWLDASMFHLDGPGALRHLDKLLAIPKLKGIQWMYGAGQPSAAHWVPVLKKIQAAGKLIQVDIIPEDLDVLLEELKPEGVMYMVRDEALGNPIKSEQEARDVMKKVEGSYKKRLY